MYTPALALRLAPRAVAQAFDSDDGAPATVPAGYRAGAGAGAGVAMSALAPAACRNPTAPGRGRYRRGGYPCVRPRALLA